MTPKQERRHVKFYVFHTHLHSSCQVVMTNDDYIFPGGEYIIYGLIYGLNLCIFALCLVAVLIFLIIC